MSVNFEFNAPQFFNKSYDPDADKFFDVTTEESQVKEPFASELKTKVNVLDAEIENKDPCADGNALESSDSEKSSASRKILNELVNKQIQIEGSQIQKQKGLAEGDEKQLIKNLESLQISNTGSARKTKIPLRTTEIFEGIKIERPYPKQHNMMTRLDSLIRTPVLNLRSRPVPISNKLDVTAQPTKQGGTPASVDCQKFIAVKRKGSPLSGKKKFVSLAERIQHFHYDTPDRFRTIPKQQIVPQNIKLRQTIPKTPVLSARYRHRPVNFPDEKEREEMELKEMKKNQVKAYPLNEKILKGPVLNLKGPVEKKPTTVPEPFNLTEMKKKELHRSPVFVFKAHPLPTTILNRPVGIPPKKIVKTTVPVTPKMKVPSRFTNLHDTPINSSTSDHKITEKTTKVQPFSFDQKIKEGLLRKEEIIKKVLEEEKKGFNSFRAQPLPNYLGKGVVIQNNSLCRADTHSNNISFTGGGKKESETLFKARPATVIHQKPFVPVLRKVEPILPENFSLNTEKRALERQKFDEKVKRKEEIQAQILQQRKEEEERLEKIKKLEERKLTEFKAKPVPKYKPFEILPADPSCLTLPKTPKCMANK